MKPLQILMIGPALTQNGGMASMEKLILKHAPADCRVQLLVSHDEGTVYYRFRVFAMCLARYLYRLCFSTVDVVYIHFSDGGSIARKLLVAIIGLLFLKPVIMHSHAGSFPEHRESLPRILRTLLDHIFRRCSAFIVLSESWRSFFVNTCGVSPDRIRVLLNPVEIPKSIVDRKNRSRTTTKILCCGRIRHTKGTFDLIRAFSDLPVSLRQSAELILAGDGEVEAARALAVELNVQSQVQLLGWVDELQRDKLLSEADIFTLPSHYEGLPMSILEAMAAGLPILSTRIGGIPDVVTDSQNGYLVNAGDIEQLCDRLKILIEDVDKRIEFGHRARVQSMSYDIGPYWSKLSEVFSDSAKRKRKY